jgi:hypothetical protein
MFHLPLPTANASTFHRHHCILGLGRSLQPQVLPLSSPVSQASGPAALSSRLSENLSVISNIFRIISESRRMVSESKIKVNESKVNKNLISRENNGHKEFGD